MSGDFHSISDQNDIAEKILPRRRECLYKIQAFVGLLTFSSHSLCRKNDWCGHHSYKSPLMIVAAESSANSHPTTTGSHIAINSCEKTKTESV